MFISARSVIVLLFVLFFQLHSQNGIAAPVVEKSVSSQKSSLIEKISVTNTEIVIQLKNIGDRKVQLLELAPYEKFNAGKEQSSAWSGVTTGKPLLKFSRFDDQRDRIFSHWQLVDVETGKPLGLSQYATDFPNLASGNAKFLKNKSIKGLQCIVDVDDGIHLNVKHSTQNMHTNQLIDLTGESKHLHLVDGIKIPIDMSFVHRLDSIIKKKTDAGMDVTLILLNPVPTQPNPKNPMIHPSTNLKEAPNHLGAFNLTDKKGVLYYRAVLGFLAKRYSRSDAKYGLISNYIIGNELQSHWWWHNMGEVEPEEMIRDYALAMRLAYYTLRKQHKDIRVFASMDHHWTGANIPNRKRAIPGRMFLDGINKKITEQGNFHWDLAFHPYPENLFEARTWNDKHVTFDFNTPKITFKNLEVLTTYFSQPQFRIDGQNRKITLSEQGFHKPKGPDGEKIQAAAYAYAYYRTMQFPEIESFIYHRHIDHAHEGGLRLGLREFKKGTITTPGNKRFIYDVFKKVNSENWETVFDFAKPIIGIQDWKELNPVKVNPVELNRSIETKK